MSDEEVDEPTSEPEEEEEEAPVSDEEPEAEAEDGDGDGDGDGDEAGDEPEEEADEPEAEPEPEADASEEEDAGDADEAVADPEEADIGDAGDGDGDGDADVAEAGDASADEKDDDGAEDEEADGEGLRAWLKAEGLFDTIIEGVLSDLGVESTADFKTFTEDQWDECVRQCHVQKKEETADQKATLAMDKLLKKIEKHWRKESGIAAKKVEPASGERPADESSKALRDESLAKGAELKKFMKENEVLDIDLLIVLVSQGVCTEADLPKIDSNDKWDEICRLTRVERSKETTDAKALLLLDKTLTKFEKLWRKASKVKRKTVEIDDSKERREDTSSRVTRDEAITKGKELKNYMRKNGCLDIDLLIILVLDYDVCAEADLDKIDTDAKWDEIVRKVRVAKNTTDGAEIKKFEALLNKFEKLWRKKTGVKVGAGDKAPKKKGGKKKGKTPKSAAAGDDDEKSSGDRKLSKREEALAKGRELKNYMKKAGLLHMDLFVILVMDYDINNEADIEKIDSQATWDEIQRKARVALNTTDGKEIKKLEGIFTKFEKVWRKKTGIKASASAKSPKSPGTGSKKKRGKGKKSGSAKKTEKSPRTSAMEEESDMDKLMAEGADLKAWLRKEQVFEMELFQELLRREVKNEVQLSALPEKTIKDVTRAVRVQKKKETKDAGIRSRTEKTLNAFEKAWKTLSAGGGASAGGKKKKTKKSSKSKTKAAK